MASSIPLPVVPIRKEDRDLFKSTNAFVYKYMSSPNHDNSHDYYHILRVVSNANRILQAEQQSNPSLTLDTTALFLAALLHDIGDYKYATAGEDVDGQVSKLLIERGASDQLAVKVQTIVKHVSYSHEVKNPSAVKEVLKDYPELAIVQDADRLDAIGAVGVARCFAFGGARRRGEPISVAIDHFDEKLYKLPGMMKTEAGKEMAVVRNKVLKNFAAQFNGEAQLSFALAD